MLPSNSPDRAKAAVYADVLRAEARKARQAGDYREVLLAFAQVLQEGLRDKHEIPGARGLDWTLRGGIALMTASREMPFNPHTADALFAEGNALIRQSMADLHRVSVAA
ncbi:MAG: hypothetical protein AAB919_01590 [Patescibacteria group bacterium]